MNRNIKRGHKAPQTSGAKYWPLYLIALLMVAGAVYMIARPYINFSSHSSKYGPFIHKMGEPDFVPPTEVWSEKNVSLYETGTGIEPVTFTKELPNGKKIERKFELKAWKKHQEEGDNPKRRAAVRDAKKEFDELVTWLNKRETINRNILVLVDTSGAITKDDSRLITERLKSLGLEKSVKNGDGLKLRGCFIASSRFENCPLTLDAQPGETNKAGQVDEIIKQLAAEKTDSKATSLYEGLANAIIPLEVLPDEVIVFTDGIENDPDTLGVSFYSKEYRKILAEQKNNEEIKRKIETRKSLPSLKDVKVTFYGPRRGVGEERELIDNSLKFAVWLFSQNGATAKQFYE
jgi:hypothetical protein